MAEKGNGGELVIILILIAVVVGGAFYFMSGNQSTPETSNINIEVPNDVLPSGEGE